MEGIRGSSGSRRIGRSGGDILPGPVVAGSNRLVVSVVDRCGMTGRGKTGRANSEPRRWSSWASWKGDIGGAVSRCG